MISFDCDKHEFKLIEKIARRAVVMAMAYDVDYEKSDALMDLNAAHSNGCPLKLQELLDADDANFSHDVFGIRRHINRETGQLENCFLPRFARPQRNS